MEYVKIDVRNLNAPDKIMKRINNTAKQIQEGAWEFTKIAVINMRAKLIQNKTIWRGANGGLISDSGIRAVRQSKYVSLIKMPQYGDWLDSMTPHFVQLKRGRQIRKWAFEKGNPTVQKLAQQQRGIFVRPHPYIRSAMNQSRVDLRTIIKNRLAMARRG